MASPPFSCRVWCMYWVLRPPRLNWRGTLNRIPDRSSCTPIPAEFVFFVFFSNLFVAANYVGKNCVICHKGSSPRKFENDQLKITTERAGDARWGGCLALDVGWRSVVFCLPLCVQVSTYIRTSHTRYIIQHRRHARVFSVILHTVG